MRATDERMNITSKAFDIIKMIKLYSWENVIKSKIKEKREKELNANYNKIKLQIIVATIYWTVENFLCMTCIIFYNIIYEQMDVENILTSLYIIHGLVESLFYLPSFFVTLFETVVSLIRIQNFLSIKNHDYSQIEYLSKDSKSLYSIEISHVDFGVERTIELYKKDKNLSDDKNNKNDNKKENKKNNINNNNLPQIELSNIENKNNEDLGDINISNNKKNLKKEMKKELIKEKKENNEVNNNFE